MTWPRADEAHIVPQDVFLDATDCRPSLSTMAPAILTSTKRRLARAKVSCTAAYADDVTG